MSCCFLWLSSDYSNTPILPSSLMLLNMAHEYLGHRSWCCNSDGALFRCYVSRLTELRLCGHPLSAQSILCFCFPMIWFELVSNVFQSICQSLIRIELTSLLSSCSWFRFVFWRKSGLPLKWRILIPRKRRWRWAWSSASTACMLTPARRSWPAI